MKFNLVKLGYRGLGLCVMLMAIVSMTSCGGGGGSSSSVLPTINAASGFYDNVSNTGGADVFSDTTNQTPLHISDLEGMIKGKQLMLVSVSENVAWFATLTSLSGTSYTADVRIYKDNVPYGTAKLSGTLNAGTLISGTLTGTGYGQGTFSLDISSENNQQADVATILQTSGNQGWVNVNVASLSGFYIDASGNVSNIFGGAGVGDFKRCAITGSVTEIANSHLYQMQITLTSCDAAYASANGTYTGYVTTRSASATNDTLVVALENSTNGYSMYGEFQ